MLLRDIIAKKHNVPPDKVHPILWKRCYSWRQRCVVKVFGALVKTQAEAMYQLIEDIGWCDSPRKVQHEADYYRQTWMLADGWLGKRLIELSGVRIRRRVEPFFEPDDKPGPPTPGARI